MNVRPAVGAAIIAAWLAASAWADEPTGTLFRVFLRDGTAVASYGEYARVGNRVVFSMWLRAATGPRLQLITLPADAVDWARTDQYTEAVRYAQYVASRAEGDYAALTGEVAGALGDIARAQDTAARLKITLRVRQRLAEWPARHYGYRAADIKEMIALVDDAIAELSAPAPGPPPPPGAGQRVDERPGTDGAPGEQRFDLRLVAGTSPPVTDILLPPPTSAETIEQGLAIVGVSQEPAERLSLLGHLAAIVGDSASSLPPAWVTWARATIRRAIDAEQAVEREYGRLVRRVLRLGAWYASRADVRGVEAAMREVRRADERLGAKRPGQIAAVMAELEARLDAARRLRLARDRWALTADLYRDYRGRVAGILKQLAVDRAAMDAIRTLAGPDTGTLPDLLARFERSATVAAQVLPPADCRPIHATLTSALQLGIAAVRLRQRAIASGELPHAWDAASAAAGSVMLAERVVADLARLMKRP